MCNARVFNYYKKFLISHIKKFRIRNWIVDYSSVKCYSDLLSVSYIPVLFCLSLRFINSLPTCKNENYQSKTFFLYFIFFHKLNFRIFNILYVIPSLASFTFTSLYVDEVTIFEQVKPMIPNENSSKKNNKITHTSKCT